MTVWILTFPEGTLPVNYTLFCAAAAFGTLQFAAAENRLLGLLLLPPRYSRWIGLAVLAAAFAWFFTSQPDLFIPGLAGGELFLLFGIGVAIAVILSLILGGLSFWIQDRLGAGDTPAAQTISLPNGAGAELYLPVVPRGALVIGLREVTGDSLDVLAARLVKRGAAVLLCAAADANRAINAVEREPERFSAGRRYLVGVGRGADRALQIASASTEFLAVLALAPFGTTEQARAGLGWLRECDWITAMRATWRRREIEPTALLANALAIYGDDDLLVRPQAAREKNPKAVVVAGARHLTLARTAAVERLAGDLFGLSLSAGAVVQAAPGGAAVRSEAAE